MRRSTAQPGDGPAWGSEQGPISGWPEPERPAHARSRAERGAPPGRARGSTGRTAARPVPIRPAGDRTHRLVLEGRLAHENASALEAALDELCDAGIGELVLDVGALRGVDNTGMRVLAMRCELCRRRGIAVRVERLGGATEKAFVEAGLLSRLPLADPSPGLPSDAQGHLDENPLRKDRNMV